MGVKTILVLLSVIVLTSLIFFYILPIQKTNFGPSSGNYNFSIVGGDTLDGVTKMQFYSNMRFPSNEISYKISNDCSLQKKNDMEQAFKILEGVTSLKFYPVVFGQEISVFCQEEDIINEGLFVAGEGGPTNITVAGEFNVILNGKILLIRDSSCATPNIAIHELLHVLGFDHSSNFNSIMFEITSCEQEIGDDIPQLINNLYSIPSLPDLTLQNVSASLNGRFLNANITITNSGLSGASSSKLLIYADGYQINEFDVDSLDIGYGRMITLTNLWVTQLSVSQIEVAVQYDFEELNKENNKIKLEIKK